MDINPWEVSNLECFLFYCCPECDYKCQDVTGFESHANTHPQSVTCIARMKEVVGMVTGEKGHHFCKLCGKYFTSSQRWSQHMKNSHGDAKPYKCDICDAGFTQPTDVVRHSDRVHKNERPFKCDICDQGFVRKYELSQHLKLSHPSLTENKENIVITDVTEYKCDTCQAVFFAESHLTKHNSKIHDINPTYPCDKCDRVLGTKNDLKRHTEAVHDKKKPYMCAKCLSQFSRKSYCKSHLKQVHDIEDVTLIIDTTALEEDKEEVQNESVTKCDIINVEDIETFQKALHKCLACKCILHSQEHWTNHQNEAHSEAPSIRCDQCNKNYSTVYELKRHVKEVHDKGGKVFQCSLCNSKFSRKYNCRDHLKKKHQSQDESHIIETKEEIKEEDLLSVTNVTEALKLSESKVIVTHVKEEDVIIAQVPETVTSVTKADVKLKCDKCEFTFKSSYFMHQHFEQVHGIVTEVTDESVTSCHICNRTFTTQEGLKHHLKYVHEKSPKPFLCDKCDKSFRSNSDLQRHIKFIHEGIKEFQCDKCDYFATTSQNLTQHKNSVHEKLRQFKCVTCESAFTQKTHLRVHIQNVHEKVKHFVCDQCGKGFADNGRLQNHLDTKHSEPAQCDYCLAIFTSKISLYRHHMSSHKNYMLSMDTTTFEFCTECGMPCINKLALKKHLYMHKNKDKYSSRKPSTKPAPGNAIVT